MVFLMARVMDVLSVGRPHHGYSLTRGIVVLCFRVLFRWCVAERRGGGPYHGALGVAAVRTLFAQPGTGAGGRSLFAPKCSRWDQRVEHVR